MVTTGVILQAGGRLPAHWQAASEHTCRECGASQYTGHTTSRGYFNDVRDAQPDMKYSLFQLTESPESNFVVTMLFFKKVVASETRTSKLGTNTCKSAPILGSDHLASHDKVSQECIQLFSTIHYIRGEVIATNRDVCDQTMERLNDLVTGSGTICILPSNRRQTRG